MSSIPGESLLQQLNWRYATKKFDATKKLSAADWTVLEEALILTASSYGLQPWKFIVVTDPALKARLRPASWNQAQVEDCSHLVVFAAKQDVTEADLDRFIARTAEVRGTTVESLAGYKGFMMGDLVNGARHAVIHEWAARQTYIAMGNLLTSAALLGIDACPFEGIEPAKYDEILGLKGTGYATVSACPVGYRADDDKYATAPKVRFEAKDVIDHR
ncbi:MAG: NAD(P)H-dependent oxidoreductase [Geothrix sp.]|uniref:NAD(P)H-dependent oxidoreductase n=1 Tax=Geothrix sp. TaxID=1962974 RepID=UPI00185780BE|nr:NAD(P)H-dependent oxidoreductase [Geothrix sp.]NWJ39745.1 NAD(P)H-dependent oxidoreductase [Geothrix sp.]WIL22240.1 MAG: NAD(P)H-dependent oxidoreductase [Geothrix sp.]